jgi:hypothetical protein
MEIGELVLTILITISSGVAVLVVARLWRGLFPEESYLDRKERVSDEISANTAYYLE